MNQDSRLADTKEKQGNQLPAWHARMSPGLLPTVRQAPAACIPPQPNQQRYSEAAFRDPFCAFWARYSVLLQRLRSYQCWSSLLLFALIQTCKEASHCLEVSRSAHIRCTELGSHRRHPAWWIHSWITFSISTTHLNLAVQPGSGFGPKILNQTPSDWERAHPNFPMCPWILNWTNDLSQSQPNEAHDCLQHAPSLCPPEHKAQRTVRGWKRAQQVTKAISTLQFSGVPQDEQLWQQKLPEKLSGALDNQPVPESVLFTLWPAGLKALLSTPMRAVRP